MNRLFRIGFLILLAIPALISPTTAANAETLPSGLPLDQLEETLDQYIEENKDTTASVSLAVFQGDETRYKKQVGYTNIENDIPADENAVYEWGSVGKLLVWVSVMQLWEQGLLELEADIQTYLPDDFFTKLTFDQPLTMTHLMSHNAGF